MNVDWLATLLSVLNFAGVPVLVVGIVFLFKAYQNALDTSKETFHQIKETSKTLQDENSRLRSRLTDRDSRLFAQLENLDNIVEKSTATIGELQARKLSLMSAPPENATTAEVLADVEKINSVIAALNEVTAIQNRMDAELRYFNNQVSTNLLELSSRVSDIAERLGDTKGRILVIEFLASKEAAEKVRSELQNSTIRGITSAPLGVKNEDDDRLQLSGSIPSSSLVS